MSKVDIYHIVRMVEKIMKNPKRDELKVIQSYLCNDILRFWYIYEKCFRNFSAFKNCNNVNEFFAFIFDIEIHKMENIMQKLQSYKNYNAKDIDTRIECMSVVLS